MMPDPEDELVARAKVLAEATGRDFEDVIADLADDGILNESNKENDADLITQLKKAAELMGAVQEINKEVAENTVLNGGDNKTEVNVDTTLEGDIVDRAIASVNRKVVELKKIALIIAPVFLLVSLLIYSFPYSTNDLPSLSHFSKSNIPLVKSFFCLFRLKF